MSNYATGQPASPEQIGAVQREVIPAAVFDAFNACIAAGFSGKSARVEQETVVKRIVEALGCQRHEVFANHYLDVEEAYRNAGWDVEYDKPAYNESYGAYFVFTRRGK